MSGGTPCRCSGPRGRRSHNWVVRQRHSRSLGKRTVASLYSWVFCTWCGALWRTCADYVHGLPDEVGP